MTPHPGHTVPPLGLVHLPPMVQRPLNKHLLCSGNNLWSPNEDFLTNQWKKGSLKTQKWNCCYWFGVKYEVKTWVLSSLLNATATEIRLHSAVLCESMTYCLTVSIKIVCRELSVMASLPFIFSPFIQLAVKLYFLPFIYISHFQGYQQLLINSPKMKRFPLSSADLYCSSW